MTITTVGYGDVYPVTTVGKLLAAMTAVAGIGAFAFPTAILGAAFLRELQHGQPLGHCPHCGRELNDP